MTGQDYNDRHMPGACHKRGTTQARAGAEHTRCQREHPELSRGVGNTDVQHEMEMQGTC